MTGPVGYSGKPIAEKLGVRAGSRVLLSGLPADVELGLPPAATVHRRPGPRPYDVVVLFCPDAATLHQRFARLAERLGPAGALWVSWPKKTGGLRSDLDENLVRAHGLAAGLVDVKVAAVDATWSGLKFVRRLADRPPPDRQRK